MIRDVVQEAAFRTLVLAAVVQCCLWLLRVRQAHVLLTIWTIVLTASLAMPVLLRFTPLRLPGVPVVSMVLIGDAATLVDDTADRLQLPSQGSQGASAVESRTPASFGSWLDTAYFVVACSLVLRVVLGVVLSLRLLAGASQASPEWAAGTRVRLSRRVAGPVTIANVVLLPIDVASWPAETRRAILAHERAHVARWDFALLIVSQLNRALFWFSPLPWWLHRRLITLTELASDDEAMAATNDRLGYAEILLEMGRRSEPLFRGSAMARPSTLPHRIDLICGITHSRVVSAGHGKSRSLQVWRGYRSRSQA